VVSGTRDTAGTADVADCLFCRIARGEIPATIVRDHGEILAFRDIAPRAPTHILVIPRRHIPSLAAATDDDAGLLGRMSLIAAAIARDEGIADTGYRVVSNVGRWGGQTVDHMHLHLLGGRRFEWPPG
jgi:histidine triad (HIT) family protein